MSDTRLKSIAPTASEKREQRWTAEHEHQAVEELGRAGAVILEDVVSLDSISRLRERMLADIDGFVGRVDAPFNWNRGNLQQQPPLVAELLFADILLNEWVIQLTRALLGPGVYNFYYEANTAMPNSQERQPVHVDTGQLWPGHISPAFACVINVPLVDMSEANGSPELWPGTHLDGDRSIHADLTLPPESLERMRVNAPPLQPKVRAGSVLLRDIRLWHAGMPNPSAAPRPMLAMIHCASWFRPAGRLVLPEAARWVTEHPTLRMEADLVAEPIDYVSRTRAYSFSG